MKKIIICLGWVLLLVGVTGRARAVGTDITINCEVNGQCNMVPNANAKLFDELNMMPGDTVKRKLTVINKDPVKKCDLTVRVINPNNDPVVSDFSAQLFTAIVKNGVLFYGEKIGDTATNKKTIADVYNQGQIDLTTISALGQTEYEWIVSFGKESGNYYQNNKTVFDLEAVFSCNNQIHNGKDDKEDKGGWPELFFSFWRRFFRWH